MGGPRRGPTWVYAWCHDGGPRHGRSTNRSEHCFRELAFLYENGDEKLLFSSKRRIAEDGEVFLFTFYVVVVAVVCG